jgi:hypothetical protein
MPDLPIAPARVWIVLSPQGNIVHAQPHEPHPADARMWASHGATVAEYVPKEDARRCDGCRHFTTRLDGYDDEPGCERGYHANSTEPHESCSRWEAKP